MVKISIIGANGFIGKNLTNKLIQNKRYKLKLFGRTSNSLNIASIPYHQINLNNKQEIFEKIGDSDVVYYLASSSIPSDSWDNPIKEAQDNLFPFLNFLEAITKSNVKKIIFTSSAGTVYGPSSIKISENDNKQPFSPHGINKLSMEYYLKYYSMKNDVFFDIYRISNIYGEGQNTKKGLGVINTFLENIITKKSITVFGDGENIRDYIHIDDVVNILSFSTQEITSTSNTFNLSSNEYFSINELIRIIKEITIEDFNIKYIPGRKSDNPAIILDNSKIAKKYPNYNFTKIKEGILKTYLDLKN